MFKGGRSLKNLFCPYSSQRHNTEIQKFQGGPSRTKSYCSVLKVHNAYNTKMQQLKGVCWRYTLALSLYSSQCLQQEDSELSGRTFALQTYSVRIVHNACNTDTYKIFRLDVRVTNIYKVLTVHNVYNTKIQNMQGGRSRCKLVLCLKLTTPTIQRYRFFRVDFRHTNPCTAARAYYASHHRKATWLLMGLLDAKPESTSSCGGSMSDEQRQELVLRKRCSSRMHPRVCREMSGSLKKRSSFSPRR